MITTVRLEKSFGARALFEDVSLQLSSSHRYGLVGANGSGKTTLLRILAGEEPASSGSVHVVKGARMSVLRQDRFLRDDERVMDVAMQGDKVVWSALEERARILEQGLPDAERLAELDERIHHFDGHTLEARSGAILEGLGVPTKRHIEPLGALSGGLKLRVLLAQVLVGGPDILLLDEPTNHLDILSIRWLERFLGQYGGCLVVISHDRRFLDNVSTHILDVDYGTVKLYTGNYSAFEKQKEAVRVLQETERARAEKEIEHRKQFVERFGAKATKARQAQSRLKQIEKIEENLEEIAQSSRRAPSFRFDPKRPSGRDVLGVRELEKAYGDNRVLHDVSLTVRRGERLAVIGPNGLGKSTLLRILVGRLDSNGGSVTWGHECHVGYFPQDHSEVLTEPNRTPLELLWNAHPMEPEWEIRGRLGRVLFSGSDAEKPVGALSGGEAARLVFALLMAEKPNVLVLDEPTNHLDLEAIGALGDALEKFDGTILFVSHDRYFVSRLGTRILELTADGPKDFPGTYEEYLERCGDDHLDADAVLRKARREGSVRATRESELSSEPKSGGSWEEQKRRRNYLKDLPARRDKAMAAIEACEARRAEIHAAYAEPGFFERTAADELARLQREDSELETKIASLMTEWERLEEEIAENLAV